METEKEYLTYLDGKFKTIYAPLSQEVQTIVKAFLSNAAFVAPGRFKPEARFDHRMMAYVCFLIIQELLDVNFAEGMICGETINSYFLADTNTASITEIKSAYLNWRAAGNGSEQRNRAESEFRTACIAGGLNQSAIDELWSFVTSPSLQASIIEKKGLTGTDDSRASFLNNITTMGYSEEYAGTLLRYLLNIAFSSAFNEGVDPIIRSAAATIAATTVGGMGGQRTAS